MIKEKKSFIDILVDISLIYKTLKELSSTFDGITYNFQRKKFSLETINNF